MPYIKKDKIKGIAGTMIFHVIVILLLIFLGFTTPLPLPGEEGVEVSLGSSSDGMGIVQPERPPSAKEEVPPPPPQDTEDEEIVTQDTEPAPAIEQKEESNPEEEPVEKVEEQPIVEQRPEVNPAALYKGKSQNTSAEGSEGITGKEGDQGEPTGSKDSKNYIGKGGLGDGLSYSLAGRTPKFLPKPSSSFQENGTVVVQITVDKYGKVVSAIAIDKGSNTTNSTLRRLAEEAARKAVFNVNPDAAEMQRGTITYHFVVKN
ncbi:MAG: TonB family protein [Bacteroidales bacterium]|nr:TonB family protein [Bacteroidales bacterium]